MPCLHGRDQLQQPRQPFNDRYPLTPVRRLRAESFAADYTCRPPRIGVPGGIAYRRCNDSDRPSRASSRGKPMPREICGLTGGKAFDICVATGNFDQCLAGAVQRGNRPACSADHFCRDDYICQAFPPDTPGVGKVKGVGFCSPTYFVFQMRIDNHTTPWKSRNAPSTVRWRRRTATTNGERARPDAGGMTLRLAPPRLENARQRHRRIGPFGECQKFARDLRDLFGRGEAQCHNSVDDRREGERCHCLTSPLRPKGCTSDPLDIGKACLVEQPHQPAADERVAAALLGRRDVKLGVAIEGRAGRIAEIAGKVDVLDDKQATRR